MDLFDHHRDSLLKKTAPLADRMRPRTLDEYIGQEHIIGPGRLLRRAITIDQLSSVIFYGPPGTGKTTLARIIANTTKAQFISINAVLAGVKEIRDAIDQAQKTLSLYSKRTILFVDEVHRFNKSQQDALLPHVENGVLILIGATTENPYFEVNKALVSRSRIFQLKGLTVDDLRAIARQAISDTERGYGKLAVVINDDALDHLVQVANGDARGVLNALELSVETTAPGPENRIVIDRRIAEESIQQRAVLYDKDGDAHYDTISAFIKSVRGSDPDAALYWMARMVHAGEDPRFIFRRMLILASEDIGLADPKALGVVMDAARAFDFVGLPEGRFHLAHACLYLASAPKSNSAMAFFDALALVAKEDADNIPNQLRDASRDGEGFGHGQGYLYPHAFRDHWVAQQYLPQAMQGKLFFQPSDQGYEKSIKERVEQRREAQVEAMLEREQAELNAGLTRESNSKSQWINRTAQNTGAMLHAVRERIFELAVCQADSLVLDVHARSGLLTFEALRRAPDGGVWAIAWDEPSQANLTKLAGRYDELHRPHIVSATAATLSEALTHEAKKHIRFDRIIGRDTLRTLENKKDFIEQLLSHLVSGGRMVLAESSPLHGQRIAALLDFSSAPELEAPFSTIEEQLYSDPAINWNPAKLEKQLIKIKTIKCRMHEQPISYSRQISRDQIDHWFRISTPGNRPSLGDELRRALPVQSVERLTGILYAQLQNRSFMWKESVAYLVFVKE